MKILIIPLLVVVVVASLFFGGCAGPAPAEPSPAPQMKGWGPMAGVAVKPDGSSYIIPWVSEGIDVSWCVTQAGLTVSYVHRAGGESRAYDPKRNVNQQIEIFESLIATGVDGICCHAVEGGPVVPLVEEAWEAGISMYTNDTRIPSDLIVTHSDQNQKESFVEIGKWFVEEANRTGKEIVIYQLWGMLGMEQCERRDEGLREGIAGSDLVSVIDGPDCGFTTEKAMEAVMTYLPAHPEVNAVVDQGGMIMGTVEGLRTLGRLHPYGNPEHVYAASFSANGPAVRAIRDGYVSVCGACNAWQLVDGETKAALLYVCCGLEVPKNLDIPVFLYTPANIDEPQWGVDSINWGEKIEITPNFDDWSVLTSPLIETPTVDMKQSGY